MGQRQISHQRKYTVGKQAYKNMLHIICHQRTQIETTMKYCYTY